MTVCEPWNFVPNQPAFADKPAWLKWRGRADTQHLLYTGAEGINPDLRCSGKLNPIRRLHCLIADYDSVIQPSMECGLDNAPPDLRPNWISNTFSGGRRLVYLFEEPIALDSVLAKGFLSIARTQLRLDKLLPGLCPKAYPNATQVYDVGTNWRHLSESLLPTSVLHLWLVEAAKHATWKTDVEIPLSAVADEVEKQYPGKWPGDFVVGARGPVFWDDGSNPSSCIVVENGIVCFSREKTFFSWLDVLGASFVRKHQADKIGGAVADTYFDGSRYYQKIDGFWQSVAKDDFVKRLKVKHGLDSSKSKHETSSETDRAEVFIQEHRKVNGVLPCLFDRRDVVERAGRKILNISCIHALEPADLSGEWAESFPWIAGYLDTFFDPHEQLDYYLAWLRRFYASALAGRLERGQNVFLVGSMDIGKTLMGYRIIGDMMGGCADASDHIVRGSEFNRALGESALWVLDDSQAASDPVAHRKFYELVKKLASNPTINFRKMYADAETQEWAGRLFCTLNDDSHSLQMIPDLSLSLEDKVHIFKATEGARKFPPRHELESMIARELPHFARWLLEWVPPEHVVARNRFGVRNYIHEGLRTAALHSSGVGDLLEIIDLWLKRSQLEEEWVGTSTVWLSTALSDEALRPLVSKFTPRILGKRFSEASRIPGSGITVHDNNRKRGNQYRIAVKADDEPRKTVRVEAAV